MIGWILLAASYLLSQPSRYGLAALRTGQYRWVRHGNDAALVEMRTGRVIAIQRHLFW